MLQDIQTNYRFGIIVLVFGRIHNILIIFWYLLLLRRI